MAHAALSPWLSTSCYASWIIQSANPVSPVSTMNFLRSTLPAKSLVLVFPPNKDHQTRHLYPVRHTVSQTTIILTIIFQSHGIPYKQSHSLNYIFTLLPKTSIHITVQRIDVLSFSTTSYPTHTVRFSPSNSNSTQHRFRPRSIF